MALLNNVVTISISKHRIFLPLYEVLASRAVFVIVSGSDGWAGRNVFGAN